MQNIGLSFSFNRSSCNWYLNLLCMWTSSQFVTQLEPIRWFYEGNFLVFSQPAEMAKYKYANVHWFPKLKNAENSRMQANDLKLQKFFLKENLNQKSANINLHSFPYYRTIAGRSKTSSQVVTLHPLWLVQLVWWRPCVQIIQVNT